MNPMDMQPGAPMGPGSGAPPPSAPFNAKEALNVPSIILIALGGICLLLEASSLVFYASGGKMMAALLESAKNVPPELREALLNSGKSSGANIAMTVLGMVGNGLTIYGALQMRAVKSWGLALAAAILPMIPCFSSCCCLIGLPVGIWAITILVKPEVKAQFT